MRILSSAASPSCRSGAHDKAAVTTRRWWLLGTALVCCADPVTERRSPRGNLETFTPARSPARRTGPRATTGGYVHSMEHSDAACDTTTTAHSQEDDIHGMPPLSERGSGRKSGSLLSSPPSRTTNLRRRCDGEPPPTTANYGNWRHDMRLRPKAMPGHIAMSEPLSGLGADTGNRTRVFSLGS